MAAKESLHLLIFLVLLINRPQVECKIRSNEIPADNHDAAVREKRFVVDPLSVIGLVVSVASAIQGAVCTFTDVCGGDEVIEKLEDLEKKLNEIQADVTSVRHDVEDIWEESKRKWYFKHIDNIIQQRKEVIQDLKSEDYSQRAKDKQQRFILEVFGTTSKDEYMEKALYHIPKLVTEEKLVTHYLDVQLRDGKSTTEAARLTWIFIRKLFRYQEDGYASVVLAASLKYKNDEASYNSTMSEVCAWWPKSNDPEYEKFCAKFVKDPYVEDRRKPQQDSIFDIRDLALVPVQLVQTDCSIENFWNANAIHYSTGYLYVAQPAAKKILVVDPKTLNKVKTLSVPGSECGGSCHPFGVSIKAEHKLLAVGAQSKLSGGESKVMLFKISGNLEEPSGISIEHYYTMQQLVTKKADVRDVAFCGQRFGYADYNGAIRTWRMPDDGSNDGKPEPELHTRYDWYLQQVRKINKGHQYYLGCSNSGMYWVVEKTNNASLRDGVGAVPSDYSASTNREILFEVKIRVLHEEWDQLKDNRSRMDNLKGIAMDSKRNLFYSSGGKARRNSVCGVYQRTYDGKRRFIREWNEGCDIQMFGMAVDEKGFLFSLQKHDSSSKCLYKFHLEIDLEDISFDQCCKHA